MSMSLLATGTKSTLFQRIRKPLGFSEGSFLYTVFSYLSFFFSSSLSIFLCCLGDGASFRPPLSFARWHPYIRIAPHRGTGALLLFPPGHLSYSPLVPTLHSFNPPDLRLSSQHRALYVSRRSTRNTPSKHGKADPLVLPYSLFYHPILVYLRGSQKKVKSSADEKGRRAGGGVGCFLPWLPFALFFSLRPLALSLFLFYSRYFSLSLSLPLALSPFILSLSLSRDSTMPRELQRFLLPYHPHPLLLALPLSRLSQPSMCRSSLVSSR